VTVQLLRTVQLIDVVKLLDAVKLPDAVKMPDAVKLLDAADLPRSGRLTDVLLAPPGAPPSAATRLAVADQLRTGLGRRVRRPAEPARCNVDRHSLRRALLPGPARAADPFTWSARTARRVLGLEGVRRCVAGRSRTPSDGVAAGVADVVEDHAGGQRGAGSLARWLGEIGPGGRAAVAAEAITWATALYGALDWRRLEGLVEVGPRDRWWDCPTAPGVGLRGRAEVSVHAAGGCTTALVTMAGGRPGATAALELGLPALVAVLAVPGPPPARVVGLWPECGRTLVLTVDDVVLERTAAAVVEGFGTQ
jgi:hypothetical protein